MNFSEFKLKIGAEPRNQGPEIAAARRDNPEFESAAVEAEAFESKLESALNIEVDHDSLVSELLTMPRETAQTRQPRWYAMAASVLVLLGAATIAWQQFSAPTNIEEYIAQHYHHDGAEVLARSESPFDLNQVNVVLAGLDASADEGFAEHVKYIKFCPSLEGQGAHMVLATDAGPVTVIYMPDARVKAPILLSIDGMETNVIAVGSGAAAIVDAPGGTVDSLTTLLQQSIKPMSADI